MRRSCFPMKVLAQDRVPEVTIYPSASRFNGLVAPGIQLFFLKGLHVSSLIDQHIHFSSATMIPSPQQCQYLPPRGSREVSPIDPLMNLVIKGSLVLMHERHIISRS